MNKVTLFSKGSHFFFKFKVLSSSENHPAMKDVLVREVERLLYRPNISPKGKQQHKWRLLWQFPKTIPLFARVEGLEAFLLTLPWNTTVPQQP
jgi:hypothetical protein